MEQMLVCEPPATDCHSARGNLLVVAGLRMMVKRRRLVILGALSMVVAGGMITLPAVARPLTASRHVALRSPRAQTADACFSGNHFGLIPFACFWSRKGFRGTMWTFGGDASDPSLRQAKDRVASVALGGYGIYAAVRLYRDTEFFGAWVCIPLRRRGVRWVYNLEHVVFNNGAGRAGYGQVVARNFKSLGFSTSGCTNPA
jgi:Peptidase inhibitor family I36